MPAVASTTAFFTKSPGVELAGASPVTSIWVPELTMVAPEGEERFR